MKYQHARAKNVRVRNEELTPRRKRHLAFSAIGVTGFFLKQKTLFFLKKMAEKNWRYFLAFFLFSPGLIFLMETARKREKGLKVSSINTEVLVIVLRRFSLICILPEIQNSFFICLVCNNPNDKISLNCVSSYENEKKEIKRRLRE